MTALLAWGVPTNQAPRLQTGRSCSLGLCYVTAVACRFEWKQCGYSTKALLTGFVGAGVTLVLG